MADPAPQDGKRSCPVIIGPDAHHFISGYGWIFLALSLVAHAVLIYALRMPEYQPRTPQQDILITLKDPPPPPVIEPPPLEPEPEVEPEPEPAPQPQPVEEPPPPEDTPPDPAPVIGVEGDGPGAIQSGATLPDFPEPEPEVAPTPPPPPPPPPPEPEPEPEPKIDVQAVLQAYAGGIKAQVLGYKTYPRVAERLHHEGSVKVGFTVSADGSLAGVQIKSSSGYDELDSAAIDAVNNAAPFDAIPAELGRDNLSLSITLKYTLD